MAKVNNTQIEHGQKKNTPHSLYQNEQTIYSGMTLRNYKADGSFTCKHEHSYSDKPRRKRKY